MKLGGNFGRANTFSTLSNLKSHMMDAPCIVVRLQLRNMTLSSITPSSKIPHKSRKGSGRSLNAIPAPFKLRNLFRSSWDSKVVLTISGVFRPKFSLKQIDISDRVPLLSFFLEEGNECQQGHWASKGLDCEIQGCRNLSLTDAF